MNYMYNLVMVWQSDKIVTETSKVWVIELLITNYISVEKCDWHMYMSICTYMYVFWKSYIYDLAS